MAQPKKFSFPMSSFFLIMALVALFFSRGLSFWFLLLLTSAIAIQLCVELLTQRMPEKLRSASRDNCYRLDGSYSQHRADRERKALFKLRSDLWAAFLIVAFFVTGGLYLMQTLFPLPLVPRVITAFLDDPRNVKDGLRAQGVDREYFHAKRTSSRISNAEIDKSMRFLWQAWPVIMGLAAVGFVGCLALIRYAYLRALQEFHSGLSNRASYYFNLDTGRLQG